MHCLAPCQAIIGWVAGESDKRVEGFAGSFVDCRIDRHRHAHDLLLSPMPAFWRCAVNPAP